MIKETTKAWHKAQAKIQHGSKRHLDIFLAWCEGKQIQSKRTSQNDWYYKDCNCPTFSDNMDYRVKPPRMIPKTIQFYGYWSNRTMTYFTTSRKLESWKEKNFPRKIELDHKAIVYEPES